MYFYHHDTRNDAFRSFDFDHHGSAVLMVMNGGLAMEFETEVIFPNHKGAWFNHSKTTRKLGDQTTFINYESLYYYHVEESNTTENLLGRTSPKM